MNRSEGLPVMTMELTDVEVRVLGVLIEKELTTPDSYPLSLNAVTSACNQKSNREPLMHLSESEVVETLDALMRKYLVREKNLSGSRVTKYAHRLSGGLGLSFDFDRNQLGTLCVLMLRGPQTVGEIRARTGRLCEFRELGEVERALEQLIGHERGPYVLRLPRQTGRKDSRYAHLLAGEPVVDAVLSRAPEPARGARDDRLEALEQRVDALELELAVLRGRLSPD
jgi:uncharacterized protein YceH (UPF0502 family)